MNPYDLYPYTLSHVDIDWALVSPFLVGLAGLVVLLWALRAYVRSKGQGHMQWVDREAAQQYREIGDRLGTNERPEFARRVVSEAIFNVIDELAERQVLTDDEARHWVGYIGDKCGLEELLPRNLPMKTIRQPLNRRQQNKLINTIKFRIYQMRLGPVPKLPDAKEATPQKKSLFRRRAPLKPQVS